MVGVKVVVHSGNFSDGMDMESLAAINLSASIDAYCVAVQNAVGDSIAIDWDIRDGIEGPEPSPVVYSEDEQVVADVRLAIDDAKAEVYNSDYWVPNPVYYSLKQGDQVSYCANLRELAEADNDCDGESGMSIVRYAHAMVDGYRVERDLNAEEQAELEHLCEHLMRL